MPAASDPCWKPGPAHPRLADGAVHAWRADVDAVSDDVLGLLCSAERERVKEMRDERNGRLWARSRGVLRALLGRYLHENPSTLRFATGRYGKLALLEDDDEPTPLRRGASARVPRLHFNVSHSGQIALYAFSEAGAVGVDVELAGRPINEIAVAARAFGAAEARRLEALAPALRSRAFLQAWVRYEAAMKCRGTGIGGAAPDPLEGEPWIVELETGPGAAGAVAAEHPARELRCWAWRG